MTASHGAQNHDAIWGFKGHNASPEVSPDYLYIILWTVDWKIPKVLAVACWEILKLKRQLGELFCSCMWRTWHYHWVWPPVTCGTLQSVCCSPPNFFETCLLHETQINKELYCFHLTSKPQGVGKALLKIHFVEWVKTLMVMSRVHSYTLPRNSAEHISSVQKM